MNKYYHKIYCTVAGILLYITGVSQTPAFYHLTTANGLYDNHVRSVAIDGRGFLWIGTEEGLNSYDGHTVAVYLKEKYPALPSDLVSYLYCDSKNKVWVGTNEGAAWMNSSKNVYRVVLQDTITKFNTKAIIEIAKKGIVLITDKGQYSLETATNKWQQIKEIPNQLWFENIKAVQTDNNNKALIVTNDGVYVYDYSTNSIVKQYPVTAAISVCAMRDNEIAVGKKNGEVIIVNTVTGNTTRQYSLNTDLLNQANTPQPLEIKQASNGDLIIATGLNGLITINALGTVTRLAHDPVNPASIIANSAYRIAVDANGAVIIGTATAGVSMYNTQLTQAAFTGSFTDAKGNYYDNYTSKILETNDNSFWIGSYDRLIKWNKKNNSADFYYYLSKEGNEIKRGNILSMCSDRSGKLWVGIAGEGIATFSEASGVFTKFTLDTMLSPVFKTRAIINMMLDDEGKIIVCCNRGVFTIDPIKKKAYPLPNNEMANELSGKVIHSAFMDSKKRIWFASGNNGIYCFNKAGKKIFHYTATDGLPSDICYMLDEDTKGNLFVTTGMGFTIIHANGTIQSYTKQNGLRYSRCESVVIDNENNAWISNKKCLVRINSDNNQLEFFDEKAGLLNDGFRVGSCLKTTHGELFWGGYKGISYFDPQVLKKSVLPLQVSVSNIITEDSVIALDKGAAVEIGYRNNRVTFSFAATHPGIPGKTYYQYMLQGFDKEWQKAEDNNHARYTALPAGSYTFELKASIDGVHWTTAAEKTTLVIVPPIWMRWWFIAAAFLILAGGILLFIQNRNKKIKQHKEELEAEQAINYFASSLHEQQTVETILWDVARNCIGRLQFEDCVIYLLDEENNVLVQKAAYGPKSPKDFTIVEPLKIPVGKGITGTVALTGKAEIIADTTKDNRYITDDKQRLSEITVPLIWGDKVIGVIDCEHHKKNYFTQKHLSILNTIASLCANKIVRAKAEEEKRKAENILTNTQQKMAEVEMQALRAQMNPHFIFNCLNSINRYIVKSDQATASLYLTRFAKLIRLILDNSGNKNVLLSNELEALKLYIEMEALRFDKKFTYQVIIDRNVNTDSIELPPLIIQPYVENAIWHGLLHKDGGGQLIIGIKLLEENMLECTIEDNGVGRNMATALKSKSATSRKSLGMQLTENRLALLNRHAALNASINIIDMKDEQQQPAGTKVILLIPV